MSRPTTQRGIDEFAERAIAVLFAMDTTCSLRSPARALAELGAHLNMSKAAAGVVFLRAMRAYEAEGGTADGLRAAARATPMRADVCSERAPAALAEIIRASEGEPRGVPTHFGQTRKRVETSAEAASTAPPRGGR